MQAASALVDASMQAFERPADVEPALVTGLADLYNFVDDYGLPDLVSNPRNHAEQLRTSSRVMTATHSPSEWAKMRPIIEQLYIREEMPLFQVRKRLADEFNFFATEQMYKKRLRTWGMRRYMSATEKDLALEGHARNGYQDLNIASCDSQKLRKIIRRAREKVKTGSLDPHVLEGLSLKYHQLAVRASQNSISDQSGSSLCAKSHTEILPRIENVPHSLSLPQELANLETIFVSLRDLISIDIEEPSPKTILMDYSDVTHAFHMGIALWKLGLPSARANLYEAAENATRLLADGRLHISVIVSIIVLEPMNEGYKITVIFINFLLKCLTQNHSSQHKLIRLLRSWSQAEHGRELYQSLNACINDSWTVNEQTFPIWEEVVQRQISCCFSLGEYGLGEELHHQATQMTQRFNPSGKLRLLNTRSKLVLAQHGHGHVVPAQHLFLDIIEVARRILDVYISSLCVLRKSRYRFTQLLEALGDTRKALDRRIKVLASLPPNETASVVDIRVCRGLLSTCRGFALFEDNE